ncbi:MAG: ribosomal protein S18-alanine N-acetyltransferase [Acidobacteriota bacterium]
MTSSIEPAIVERDLDAIAEIAQASFTNSWTRAMFAQELATPPLSRSYVYRTAEGAVVGFCTSWLIVDELHINTIAVRPEFRGKGIGRQLLAFLLNEARGHGARRAMLEVRASNTAAIALYSSFGFTTEAIRKGYYPNPPEDALVLARAI